MTQLAEVIPLTVGDTAYQRIRADIVSGRIAPGHKLRLDRMRAEYGAGISTLRELLSRLAAEGLVLAEGQRGFEVPPVTAQNLRELAELRLSEAVLRELPKLERFQAFLRLAVAAGPLLGLIGTVIGMIITFHAITAAGTSDPRMMAQGIGQAMIATVLGLGIAIPLLFINAGLAAFSRGIIHVLDEQTHELLAEKS